MPGTLAYVVSPPGPAGSEAPPLSASQGPSPQESPQPVATALLPLPSSRCPPPASPWASRTRASGAHGRGRSSARLRDLPLAPAGAGRPRWTRSHGPPAPEDRGAAARAAGRGRGFGGAAARGLPHQSEATQETSPGSLRPRPSGRSRCGNRGDSGNPRFQRSRSSPGSLGTGLAVPEPGRAGLGVVRTLQEGLLGRGVPVELQAPAGGRAPLRSRRGNRA